MIVNKPRRVASPCSVVSFALALTLVSSCNLVLDNEKRSLSQRFDSTIPSDVGAPDSAVDSGQESGPIGDADSGPETCGGEPFPQCVPNMIDMDMESCGECGLGTRTRQRGCTMNCRWASWSEWSACEQPAEVCKPGMTEMNMESCGNCDVGMRKTSRTCTRTCGWSDWNPEACIGAEATCKPETILHLPDIGCGAMCGHSTQTQTCNASCGWDPAVTGACMSEGMCKPGVTRMATPGGCNPDYCNKGVQQRIETCTQSCTWGTPTAMGMCTIPTTVCRPMDLGGMGYRCRQNDPGYREPCNASTSPNACTWSGTREPFAGCS
jgi:hypothetical protein